MSRSLLPIVGVMILVACSTAPTPEPEATAQDIAVSAGTGEATYMEHCAGCHETGMLGAPVVGDPTSWEQRSQLWQAVLVEHAKTGYFDMPAKGGRPDISDAAVAAATEYMLEMTFTDRPAD